MKRIATGIIVLLVLVSMVSCGGSDSGGGAGGGETSSEAPSMPQVSEDDAKEAFLVGFATVFAASIAVAFGQEVEGATIDGESMDLTLDDLSLTDFLSESGQDLGYDTVSGTAKNVEEQMVTDLTLTGGPIETIQFTVDGEMLQSEEGFSIDVTANGQEMTIEVTADDMQG